MRYGHHASDGERTSFGLIQLKDRIWHPFFFILDLLDVNPVRCWWVSEQYGTTLHLSIARLIRLYNSRTQFQRFLYPRDNAKHSTEVSNRRKLRPSSSDFPPDLHRSISKYQVPTTDEYRSVSIRSSPYPLALLVDWWCKLGRHKTFSFRFRTFQLRYLACRGRWKLESSILLLCREYCWSVGCRCASLIISYTWAASSSVRSSWLWLLRCFSSKLGKAVHKSTPKHTSGHDSFRSYRYHFTFNAHLQDPLPRWKRWDLLRTCRQATYCGNNGFLCISFPVNNNSLFWIRSGNYNIIGRSDFV